MVGEACDDRNAETSSQSLRNILESKVLTWMSL
jgi:hypothetical protein